MKKLLFIFLILATNLSAYEAIGTCGFVYVNVDGYNVEFEVHDHNGWYYEIDTGEGILTSQDSEDNTFNFCYSASGNYTLVLTYYNNSMPACGASHHITIVLDCDLLTPPDFTYKITDCAVQICDVDSVEVPPCFEEVSYTLDMGDGSPSYTDDFTDLCAPPDENPPCEEVTFLSIFDTNGVDEEAAILIETPDSNFIIGGNKGDSTILIHLDEVGSVIWSRTFDFIDLHDEFLQGLVIDSDTNLVGGGFGLVSATNQKINYAFKYNYLSNSLIWSTELQNAPPFSTYRTFLEKAADDNYFVIGDNSNNVCDAMLIELDRNTGTVVNEHNYDLGGCESFEKAVIHNNQLYLAGTYTTPGGGLGKTRSAISQIDFSGNEIWSRLYLVNPNITADIQSSDILIKNNSIYALSRGSRNSTSTTNVTIHLQENKMNGDVGWAKSYNITQGNTERPNSLTATPDGGFLISGDYVTSGSDTVAFIMKVNHKGNIEWAKSYDFTMYINDNLANHLILRDSFIYIAGHHKYYNQKDITFLKLDLEGDVFHDCTCPLDLSVTQIDINNPYDGWVSLNEYNQGYTTDTINVIPKNIFLDNDVCTVPCIEEGGSGGSDEDETPSGHVYECNGTYDVCLTTTVTEASGNQCTVETCKEIEITDCNDCCQECNIVPPTILVAKEDCTVVLCTHDESNTCDDGSYFWDLGDGNTSNESVPIHQYAGNGIYIVCVTYTVVNSLGVECSVTECEEVVINDCDGCCGFDLTIGEVLQSPFDPCFAYISVADRASPICSDYELLFDYNGDGENDDNNPFHLFEGSGTHTVCVTMSNGDCELTECTTFELRGCGDRDSKPEEKLRHVNNNRNSINEQIDVFTYPNPAINQTTFEIGALEEATAQITLTNSTGKTIRTYNEKLQIGTTKLQINDLSTLPTGVYFYQIQVGDYINYGKLLIQ